MTAPNLETPPVAITEFIVRSRDGLVWTTPVPPITDRSERAEYEIGRIAITTMGNNLVSVEIA